MWKGTTAACVASVTQISQLVDDIQRLQTILNTLKETSASKIAQLEELVNEKDKMIVELGEKLIRQRDYEDIKKELSIIKTVECTNARLWEHREDDKKLNVSPVDLLTKEVNKPSNLENISLKSDKQDEPTPAATRLPSCPAALLDSGFATTSQEAPTNFSPREVKEENLSRPPTPPPRDDDPAPSPEPEDRKPPLDHSPLDMTAAGSPPQHRATSPPSAVNLSNHSSPTVHHHHQHLKEVLLSSLSENPSLSKLQECLRHNIDKYANETLNTLNIARCVRELLSVHNIGQRLFAKFVLGLSQGTVSELLSKPKPWDKLTEKGRDSYRKMHAWASDEHCIAMLKSLVPRRAAERRSTLLSSPPGKDCPGGGGAGLSCYKPDDQGAEERIAQILNEAQIAMMNAKQQQDRKSPSSFNGTAPSSALNNADQRSTDSCDEARGVDTDGGGNKSNSSTREASDKSFRRSRKYENDDIPQEMVARIYQEELAKLIGQRVEEQFRTPRDQFERTQEEIRQALTIYHQELTRLSHLMPQNHQNNSLGPFNGADAGHHHHHHLNNNGGAHHFRHRATPPEDGPVDATVRDRSRSTDLPAKAKVEDPELRHHGSAFSLVHPKVEPTSNSNGSNNASASNGNHHKYQLHNSSSPASEIKTPSPGTTAPPATTEDLSPSAASPLQRIQSITNSLLSQSSLAPLPQPPQRPAKAVLPPITQQQFDQYNNVNTEDIVKKVKEQLSQYSISQRLFGESVLGLSQGSVSDLLARPKPWHMLTQKGREPFIRMKIFLEDENAVHKLVASQYKIAPEKLMRTGSFGGATNPSSIMTFGGSNKLTSRPPEPNPRLPESRPQLVPVTSAYNPPRSLCGTPEGVSQQPLSLTVSTAPTAVATAARKAPPPAVLRGYSQPSVYEMAALTTDLDTQVITSRIKETLMAHNIGQKIFGGVVLGLSQGSVSELLSKPKPWHMLSIKGREPFIRMQMWLNDPHNVDMLQTIKNERREANKRRRTGDGPTDSPRSQSDGPLYGGYGGGGGFAPPSPYPAAKKPRVLFTEEQKEALRLAFSLDPYPSTATIEFLASELNLSVRTITNWFHNHRMRMKQQASPDGTRAPVEATPPPVREGLAFDPVQYRMMLNQRLADKCREKGSGGPLFLGYGSLPYLYSPYRNCSPLSSSGDDAGTLDLSMSGQLRHAMMDGSRTGDHSGSSTDDRSNSEMNDDSNLSSHDREDDGPARQAAEAVRPAISNGGSSNRRKPAMPQWVNPAGLDLSPDSDVHTDEDDDFDDMDEDDSGDGGRQAQERIINGVCVRQTDDLMLLTRQRTETVHVLPTAVKDGIAADPAPESDCSDDDNDDRPTMNGDASTTNSGEKRPLSFPDEEDESWDDAEAKDRRKNIEKLQQRLEKEEAGEDWEF